MSETDDAVDVAIIGAGVIGCAIAAAAARHGSSVLVLEREDREGTGVTSRNSGVVHSGLYYPPGSRKARACVRGQALVYEWAARRGVAHRRTGKLVIVPASAPRVDAAVAALHALHENARRSGARGCELISPERAARLEPSLPQCAAAMLCRHSGIIDVHELTRSLLADACQRDVVVATRAEVTRVTPGARDFTIESARGPVRATRVINAAGLYADRVARMVGLDDYTIYPCRGDYFRLRRTPRFEHLIYPVRAPGDPGLGIHLTLELDGGQRVGPDAEYVDARDDFGPAEHKHAVFLEATRRLLGPLAPEQLAYDGCGIRPKLRAPHETRDLDFILREQPAGFLHLLGIESPGVTAALALAEEVADGFLKGQAVVSG
ncbi:MAG: NAD(P)/FAD-dependent oxidoreductase [Myxococcales bacterium]|nr:NAD(P)/FAD-dependent oxidoreductase [Myxococcales bacterium]MCB9750343.1 NAD(P)/FAD-dependent oxidoreductase [Myxococcales bacterium]